MMAIKLHLDSRPEFITIGMCSSDFAKDILIILFSAQVDCDVQQWIDTENGTANGTIFDLLSLERETVSNQLMSLFHG